MKKWTLIDQARTPEGKTISLHEHDGSYSIRLDNDELMSTRQHYSEDLVAELACAHLKTTPGACVLIGGLGCGFTLKAALASLPADASVVVAEISPAVIGWNRNAAFPLAGEALADPRVTIVQEDVGDVIRKAKASFDAIILDVDNGPAALSCDGNYRLYDNAGLQRARTALRPLGCYAIWSAVPDESFKTPMTQAGFKVEVHRCRSHGTRGRRHLVFLGRMGEY